MNVKAYMMRYRRLSERIRQIDLDIAAIETEAEGRAITSDGLPKGSGVSDPTAVLAMRLSDLKADRLLKKEEAWRAREEIQRVIDAVPDPVHSRLLYDRYVLCMRWEEIADELHYAVNYVAGRLHGRSLQSAGKILQDVKEC